MECRMTVMHFEHDGRRLAADLADPLPIAVPLDFGGPQPGFHDAGPATSRALRTAGFVGDTREGGSCNCEQVTLVPHCNGTHTECLGHLTDDRISVAETLRGGMHLALLLSVQPVAAEASDESSDPAPAPGDKLITAAALAQGAAAHVGLAPQALVIRTLPNSVERMSHRYAGPAPAPFLSREAAGWLVDRGVQHLVLDVPSADRAQDDGRLTAHRVFFGLPPGARRASESSRPRTTITELAFIAPTIRDGWYLLDLQIPPFLSDAAPSRPLLYPVRFG
jgi:kynurenine formamidase